MSRKFKIRYSPSAKNDLRNIAAYILYELHSRTAAENVISKIRKEIHSLACMPDRYQRVEWEPWASMGIRRFSVGNDTVFYSADKDDGVVTITRILYGRRDIEHIIQ